MIIAQASSIAPDFIMIGIVTVFLLLSVTSIVLYRREGSEESWSESDLDGEASDVVFLLRNEGQIKQKRIAEEFGWSDAKVSRITTKLVDSGVVEKTMIDRENVVSLNKENEVESN